MNRMLLALKRPFIWLYRFRHRCGYGVHSPFAFNLITHVIYETTPYYKYKELASEQKRLMPQKDRAWGYESLKVKRLLFRLVNYAQPATIVDAGMQAASSLYLKAAKEGADYTAAADLSELRDGRLLPLVEGRTGHHRRLRHPAYAPALGLRAQGPAPAGAEIADHWISPPSQVFQLRAVTSPAPAFQRRIPVSPHPGRCGGGVTA